MGIHDDSEPTDEEREAYELAEMMNEYSVAFEQLRQTRHEEGAAEYGVFTFLGNDVIRMMAEELADTANYCRMQFIKLMMLNNALVAELEEAQGEAKIDLGAQAFKGTKTGWKKDE